ISAPSASARLLSAFGLTLFITSPPASFFLSVAEFSCVYSGTLCLQVRLPARARHHAALPSFRPPFFGQVDRRRTEPQLSWCRARHWHRVLPLHHHLHRFPFLPIHPSTPTLCSA